MPGRGGSPLPALIVLGVGAAYAYSAFATIERSPQVYFDTASMVLMLFTVGYYLDAAGRARAARDLQPLLAAESEWATVVAGDAEHRLPVRDVAAGMLVRVRPGERIPVDGVIVEGNSHIDEAVITGESRQIAKGVGAPVIAGSINLDGPLLIRSSGAGNATRWAQICRSVRDALLRRSSSQRLADGIVGVFVPIVLVLGVATAIYWVQHVPFDRALLVGLAVLVVACPCAVGPCRTDGHLARHRTPGPARLPGPRPRRARGAWRARGSSPSTRPERSPRARRASPASTARGSTATRCWRAPPDWSAIPSMAWPAPSSRRPPRAACSRSPRATCGPCLAAASAAAPAVRSSRPAAAR